MLAGLIDKLETAYGPQAPPHRDPLEIILRENVAYLADDARRDQAMAQLQDKAGLSAESILSANEQTLCGITSGGILAENSAAKLRRIAEIAVEEWDGDLSQILTLPHKKALRALKKFPGIGEPGAEKVLLFTGTVPILALDSNGLRVLLRLGYGKQGDNYTASYRSAQRAAAEELPPACETLTRAHLLLRRHGKESCKTNRPLCAQCILTRECPSSGKL